MNPDKVPLNFRNHRSLSGDRPGFNVAFEEIGVSFEKLSRGAVSTLARKRSGADERCDVRCQRGRRVPAGFLPTLLLGGGTVADEVARGPHHHRVRLEVSKGGFTA